MAPEEAGELAVAGLLEPIMEPRYFSLSFGIHESSHGKNEMIIWLIWGVFLWSCLIWISKLRKVKNGMNIIVDREHRPAVFSELYITSRRDTAEVRRSGLGSNLDFVCASIQITGCYIFCSYLLWIRHRHCPILIKNINAENAPCNILQAGEIFQNKCAGRAWFGISNCAPPAPPATTIPHLQPGSQL